MGCSTFSAGGLKFGRFAQRPEPAPQAGCGSRVHAAAALFEAESLDEPSTVLVGRTVGGLPGVVIGPQPLSFSNGALQISLLFELHNVLSRDDERMPPVWDVVTAREAPSLLPYGVYRVSRSQLTCDSAKLVAVRRRSAE